MWRDAGEQQHRLSRLPLAHHPGRARPLSVKLLPMKQLTFAQKHASKGAVLSLGRILVLAWAALLTLSIEGMAAEGVGSADARFISPRLLTWTSEPDPAACEGRAEMTLGVSRSFLDEDLVPSVRDIFYSYTPCFPGVSTKGIWLSVTGDGTPLLLRMCFDNSSLQLAPEVSIHVDVSCADVQPCTACSVLQCTNSTEGLPLSLTSLCEDGISWQSELGQEYIIHMHQRVIIARPDSGGKLIDGPRSTSGSFTVRADGLGCDGINTGKIMDPCGECGGNGYSCGYRGCDGIVGSGKVFDACGECDGHNETCRSGCDNEPNSNKVFDECGECGGNGSSCAGCDGIPMRDPAVRAKKDSCGVCKGNGSTCIDCSGVVNGPHLPDACGCNDWTTCLDCAGVPWGSAVMDDCGVCNGKNKSCYGCDGIKGSGKVEVCGVCGGNGSSCPGECEGMPFSVKDACGVCNGDNSSCMCVFYEEFSLPEMDCRLMNFTLRKILVQIDVLTEILRETKKALIITDDTRSLNRVILEEVLRSNEFIDDCLDHYGSSLSHFIDTSLYPLFVSQK